MTGFKKRPWLRRSQLRVVGALFMLGGSAHARDIWREARLNPGSLYPALDGLFKKGVVDRYTQNDGQAVYVLIDR